MEMEKAAAMVGRNIVELKEDASKTAANVGVLMSTAGSNIKDMATDALENVTDEIKSAKTKARQYTKNSVARLQKETRTAVNDAEDSIGDHPLASLALAAAIGFAIGRLTSQ